MNGNLSINDVIFSKETYTFPIFKNVDSVALEHILNCLEANIKNFEKGDIIYKYVDNIDLAGVVLSGNVKVSTFNLNGTEHNVSITTKGKVFAESFALSQETHNFLQVTAMDNCQVLFLKASNLLSDVAVSCPHASRITTNLLEIIVKKNIDRKSVV